MKRIIIVALLSIVSIASFAQGKSGNHRALGSNGNQSVQVDFDNMPEGSLISITFTGEDGFTRNVTGSKNQQTISLPSNQTYTITANLVTYNAWCPPYLVGENGLHIMPLDNGYVTGVTLQSSYHVQVLCE